MKFKLAAIIIYICLIFVSCVSIDDGVDLFYMGKDSIQYFFPSREWLSLVDGVGFESDWLYRNYSLENEEGGSRTILNISLYSSSNLYRTVPQEIRISSEQIEIVIPSEQISLVYLDKGKTRYSSWMYSELVDHLMRYSSSNLAITLVFDSELVFKSSSDFIPQIQYFKEVILGIPIK